MSAVKYSISLYHSSFFISNYTLYEQRMKANVTATALLLCSSIFRSPKRLIYGSARGVDENMAATDALIYKLLPDISILLTDMFGPPDIGF